MAAGMFLLIFDLLRQNHPRKMGRLFGETAHTNIDKVSEERGSNQK